jgi:hypothetical protein
MRSNIVLVAKPEAQVVHTPVTSTAYLGYAFKRGVTIVGPRRKIESEEAGRDPLLDLKKQLSEEYEDQPEAKIDQAARHSLDRLADVKVREFVALFAWRHAREHLRRAS